MTVEPDPGAILPERVSTAYRLPPDPKDCLPLLSEDNIKALEETLDPRAVVDAIHEPVVVDASEVAAAINAVEVPDAAVIAAAVKESA